ncbi:MAG: hypothetical protein GXP38_15775, partial [Chloroflexi bacterium]|nr:hypothetical protein [Chloroflexota bacterium]
LASGEWRVEDAVPLHVLQEQRQHWQDYLTPLARVSLGLPTVTLTPELAQAFTYGQRLSLVLDLGSGECQVLGPDNRCLGIGRYDAQQALLSPRKVFLDPHHLSPT